MSNLKRVGVHIPKSVGVPTVHIPTVWNPEKMVSSSLSKTYTWTHEDVDKLVDTLKEWSDYLFDYTQAQTGFPISNVYSKVWSDKDEQGEPTTTIVFALAGFSKEDVTVKHDKNNHKLIVEGTCHNQDLKDTNEDDDGVLRHWIHKGISGKDFARTFTMHEHAVIDECTMTDGLLKIVIKKDVPEEQKPVSIKIK